MTITCSRTLTVLGVLAVLGCGGAEGEPPRSMESLAYAPRFDSASAYELLKRQVEFGPRVPGTDGHRAMAGWVEEHLSERADTLIVQRFTHVSVDGDTLQLFNFLARFRVPGTQPVLLLAHWDTRPYSDNADDPADREKPVEWELYNIASDRTETTDLAELHPALVKKMSDHWAEWAKRVNVYPKTTRKR